MIKKNPLGRGLETLIPKTVDSKNITEIDILDIIPNTDQPRSKFDDEKLLELADSIKQKGVIQPIIVTYCNGKYQLIAGERRWRAAGIVGLKKIPAIIKDIGNENEKLELAIIENIQREDLNPVELAKAYRALMEKYSYTQEQLSSIVSKNRSTITNTLRLLNLDDKILDALSQNLITEGHARALIGVDRLDALELVQKIIKSNLTVRDTEKLVQKLKRSPGNKKNTEHNPFIISLKNEIEEILKTEINIKPSRKGGKIELIYKNDEDLHRIISFLRGE